jgi:glycosyltransferase involved in cell wall biosynthesis
MRAKDGRLDLARPSSRDGLSDSDRALLADRTVVIVMPAYNAARTLAETWQRIPKQWVNLVILVDDHSKDDTVGVARSLNLHVISHPHNVGYGGNQKTCYMEALRRGADVVVMLHPDGQYDPTLVPDLVRPVLRGEADLVLGSRFLIRGGARRGGMPLYKYVSNRFLTEFENLALRRRFSELHTGYSAYSRTFLETVPFLRNSNDFVFDTEVVAQAVAFGFRVAEVPVATRYFPEVSSAASGRVWCTASRQCGPWSASSCTARGWRARGFLSAERGTDLGPRGSGGTCSRRGHVPVYCSTSTDTP